MNILFIVFNTIGRGTYFRAFELARALSKKGHSLTLMATIDRVNTEVVIRNDNNVKIIGIPNLFHGPIQSGWDIRNLLIRNKIVKSLSADIVHGFESRPTVIYPALLLYKKGTPLFLDWADWFGKYGSVEERPNPIFKTIFRPFENYYETKFRDKPIGTTVICKTLFERAKALNLQENSLLRLPNGFDLPDWKPISIAKAREKVGLSENKFLVGYLGSLFPRDAELLTKTANDLNIDNPDIRFLHVGHSNYEIRNGLTSPDSVITTGSVGFHDMQTYLSACDILLLPFRDSPANNGRFPLKFSNYLACERPIISTDVGDIPGYIQKWKVGWITDDNPQALSTAIIKLLNNLTLMEEFGKASYRLSTEPSESWSKRADDLISFYQERIND